MELYASSFAFVVSKGQVLHFYITVSHNNNNNNDSNYNNTTTADPGGRAVWGLLGLLRVRIPPATLKSVICECFVSSGGGLRDWLITGPDGSYRVWRVWVWSWSLDNGGGSGPLGLSSHEKEQSTIKIELLLCAGLKDSTVNVALPFSPCTCDLPICRLRTQQFPN
jgi:hypothetical protein